MDPLRGSAADYSTKLMLATVDSYDIQVDEAGNAILDDKQNTIPTGLLNITLMEREGRRVKVPFSMGVAGNSVFFGGLPEIGTQCVVGWRQQNQPIIIGFIPPGFANIVSGRQTLPNMQPGEVIMQASIPDIDVDGNDNFFMGARVFLDRYGRVIVKTNGYEMITGYLLSNEYTQDVSYSVDPITGNPVFLREVIQGGVERRVDNQGNGVWTYGNDKIERVGRDAKTEITGLFDLLAKAGISLHDDRGNEVTITKEGTLRLVTSTGSLETSTQGSHKQSVAGNLNTAVVLNKTETVGGDSGEIVGGAKSTAVAGAISEKSTKEGKTTEVLKNYEVNATQKVILTGQQAIELGKGATKGVVRKDDRVYCGTIVLNVTGSVVVGGTYTDAFNIQTPLTNTATIVLYAKPIEFSGNVKAVD